MGNVTTKLSSLVEPRRQSQKTKGERTLYVSPHVSPHFGARTNGVAPPPRMALEHTKRLELDARIIFSPTFDLISIQVNAGR
jgi:hypothetical protein